MVYVGMTKRPLEIRTAEHRRAVETLGIGSQKSALADHIRDVQPVSERGKHDWGEPVMAYPCDDPNESRVVEALLVRVLPAATVANTAADADPSSHPAQHVLELDAGWIAGSYRWLCSWPDVLFARHDNARSTSSESETEPDS